MKKLLVMAPMLLVASCNGSTVVKDRPVAVNTPVTVPCALERPQRPVPLVEQTPGWDSLDVRQKAAAVGKWALELVTYTEQLEAATSSCQ